jgi:hypothetical protein
MSDGGRLNRRPLPKGERKREGRTYHTRDHRPNRLAYRERTHRNDDER